MKSNNKTGEVNALDYATVISRGLNIDRNTFVNAVTLYNSLIGGVQSVAAEPEAKEENTGKRRGRPKGSRNAKPAKAKRGPGRPKAKRGPGRPKAKRGPGRPKASNGPGRPAAKKSMRGGGTGARRGRPSKHASGQTLREAISGVLSSNGGPIGVPVIVEQLQKVGYNSKSLSTQVAQELSRMFKAKSVTRPSRGQYEWSGKPVAVAAVTTPADAEQEV